MKVPSWLVAWKDIGRGAVGIKPLVFFIGWKEGYRPRFFSIYWDSKQVFSLPKTTELTWATNRRNSAEVACDHEVRKQEAGPDAGDVQDQGLVPK